jgi:uncharacterized protein (DUF983 family)
MAVADDPKKRRAEVPPLGTRLARGATLRCPVCGHGGVLDGWLRLKRRCPHCGMRLERGEHDFFLGGMVFNIAFAEGLLAIIVIGVMIATWPAVPWTLLEFGGPAMMIVVPFIFYPFSLLMWLGFDLSIRALTVEEWEWYRSAAEHETRRSDDR